MKVTRITDTGGDWEAVYIDDDLIDQNHSIGWWSFIERLFDQAEFRDERIESIDSHEVNMEEFGQCDESLAKFMQEAGLSE